MQYYYDSTLWRPVAILKITAEKSVIEFCAQQAWLTRYFNYANETNFNTKIKGKLESFDKNRENKPNITKTTRVGIWQVTIYSRK